MSDCRATPPPPPARRKRPPHLQNWVEPAGESGWLDGKTCATSCSAMAPGIKRLSKWKWTIAWEGRLMDGY